MFESFNAPGVLLRVHTRTCTFIHALPPPSHQNHEYTADCICVIRHSQLFVSCTYVDTPMSAPVLNHARSLSYTLVYLYPPRHSWIPPSLVAPVRVCAHKGLYIAVQAVLALAASWTSRQTGDRTLTGVCVYLYSRPNDCNKCIRTLTQNCLY